MTRQRFLSCVILTTAVALWLFSPVVNAAPSFSFGKRPPSSIDVKALSFDNNGHFKASIKLGGNVGLVSDWSRINSTTDPSDDPLATKTNLVSIAGADTGGYFEMAGTYEKGASGELRMHVTDAGSGAMKVKTFFGSSLMETKMQFTDIVLNKNPLDDGSQGTYGVLFALNIAVGNVNNSIDSKILDAFDDVGTGILLGKAKVKLKQGDNHCTFSGGGHYGGTAVACAVPEPGTWVFMTTAFVGIGAFLLRRRFRES